MTTAAVCSPAISARSVRNSPFRESEWDRRLDHLLQDLENSATSVNAAAAQSRSYSSERKVAAAATDNTTGYAQVLSKSRSTSSLGATPTATDNMLKDLDAALKASSNYIESHRTVQMPNGTQEFHEYRSTTTSGNQNGATPRNVSDDFNLERQVQHMMPSQMSHQGSSSGYSGLQSANMISSMQQQSSSTKYTSYKVQSNSYTSGGSRMTTDYSDNSDGGGVQTSDAHRPGSRLKANIDELDTLLSDLNNAQNTRSTSSADDYGDQNHLQGQVKKTVHSMSTANEYSMQNTSSEYNRQKPPSPSPTRRNRTPVMMPSPVPPARRTSPSPARRTSPPRGQSPPRKQRSPSPLGHAYYSKYHSTYSSSQNNTPVSFPTCPSPSPNRGPNLQTPPKKVDDLMTELREFDPSIQHVTSFTEPSTITTTTTHHKSHKHTAEEDSHLRQRRREPSPICSPKQPSTPGPAVYYPPGELFSSTRNDDIIMPAASGTGRGETDHATLDTTTSSNGARAAKVRAEYGYKSGRYQEAESNKQGAAVVPICLPLCCAAPCVIL